MRTGRAAEAIERGAVSRRGLTLPGQMISLTMRPLVDPGGSPF
jgi:hypothetical protein